MRKRKSLIILPDEDEAFSEYVETIVQRIPRYAVKRLGEEIWRSRSRTLGNRAIVAHLLGEYAIATLGLWYPVYGIFDIDDRSLDEVERIRETLGLDTTNSMLFSSESPDSYHLIFRPEYRGKPPTLKLISNVFKDFERRFQIEVFPRKRQTFRLPLGPYQKCLDLDYQHLIAWDEKLYWLRKLDPYDLSTVPRSQLQLDLTVKSKEGSEFQDYYNQGRILLEGGLQAKGSRHDSQAKVLYFFYRSNIPIEEAKRATFIWIKTHHNGFSKEINKGRFDFVKKEISDQAEWIYGKYGQAESLPDTTDLRFRGWITKADLESIIRYAGGSLPRMRFLFQIIKFMYPRRHRLDVRISANLFIRWASKDTYLTYLRELEEKGVVERGTTYQVSEGSKRGFAKRFGFNWDFQKIVLPIMLHGRSPQTLEDAVCIAFTPEEFRETLIKLRVERTTALKMVQRIWGSATLKPIDVLSGKMATVTIGELLGAPLGVKKQETYD